MSWFSRLFKKKAGGTVVGNVLRAVGNHYSAGLWGKFFPAPISARVIPTFRSLYPQYEIERGLFDDIVVPDLGDVIGTVLDALDNNEYLDGVIPDDVIDILDTMLGDEIPEDFASENGMTTGGVVRVIVNI